MERKLKVWSVEAEYEDGFILLRYFKYDYDTAQAEQEHNLHCWADMRHKGLISCDIRLVD